MKRGINHYIATISRVDNEINYQNNVRDFFIEVTDNRQQILLIANSPHPDIAGVFREIIETNPNIQLKTVMFDDFDGNVGNTNLVILHQLPSTSKPATALFEKLQKQNIPVFLILGSQTNVGAGFNALDAGSKISENQGIEIQADPQQDFSLFTIGGRKSKTNFRVPTFSQSLWKL